VAVLASGCSSSEDPPPIAGEERTVALPFCVKEFFSGLPWPGTRIAVHDRDDIAPQYTDELGCATLRGLPLRSEVLVSITAVGLTPFLATELTGESDGSEIRMDVPALEWRPATANMFGFRLDYTKGGVGVWVTFNDTPTVTAEGGVPGVQLGLHANYEAGPFFNEGASAWAPPDTRATTESGIGAFFNVDPGKTEVLLTLPPGVQCIVGYDEVWSTGVSWPGGDPGAGALRVRVPSYAGFYTGAGIRCLH